MPSMAMKKFSVMKNSPATIKMPKKPIRPTTPAPAAFLLTASVLLLSTSKKPEEGLLSGCGSLIGSYSLRGLRRVGLRLQPLDVGGVIFDRLPGGPHDQS